MTFVALKAPAKINWFLSVTGKRDDGYHNIVSLVQCVSLYDNLLFRESEEIALDSDLGIPARDNLAYKAAVILKKYSGYQRGVHITLEKHIPSAAGLGGGSSDAAFTLIGLNRLWRLNLGMGILMQLGSEIGSDVPFFLRGPFSLVEGRGEIVSPIEPKSPAALLLVNPRISVSAAWAYSNIKAEILTKKPIDIKLFCQTLDSRDYGLLQHMVANDLEPAVIAEYREVADIKGMLTRNGAAIVSMSGSGPTVFAVFRSTDEALRASEHMGTYWCRVVSTLGMNEKPEIWDEK